MTYNVQDILSEVVRSCSPKLHNRLRDAGEQLGCNTITETIMTLVDLHAPDSDEEEIREMFADCRRAINNRDSDLIKYKQKKNRTSQLELDL